MSDRHGPKLQIEYPGALYHVTSRGDHREAIFDDDQDRTGFLNVLGDVVSRFQWRCHAYCLMGNHYQLMSETPGEQFYQRDETTRRSLYSLVESPPPTQRHLFIGFILRRLALCEGFKALVEYGFLGRWSGRWAVLGDH